MNWFEWEWPSAFISRYVLPALLVSVLGLITVLSAGFSKPLAARAPDPDAGTVLGTHAAFECAAIADVAGYADEAKRLREIGYRKGHEVLKALREERVDREQLDVPAPGLALLVYEGPSADFILGRVYEYARSQMQFEIHRAARFRDDQSRRQREAQTLYLGRNCPGMLLHHDLQ